jgi:hypothetical protein
MIGSSPAVVRISEERQPVHRAEPAPAAALQLAEERYPMKNVSDSNRRRQDRIATNANIYVVVHTNPQMLGQMVEISISGLSFTFVDLENVSEKVMNHTRFNLDLFGGGRGYFIKNLNCRLKSRIETHPGGTNDSQIIRVGVEFENPTLPQQIQINALIRWHTVHGQ